MCFKKIKEYILGMFRSGKTSEKCLNCEDNDNAAAATPAPAKAKPKAKKKAAKKAKK